MAHLLTDSRPAVRKRALHLLGKAGAAAVPELRQVLKASGSPEARANVVWALTRLNDPSARAVVRSALDDRSDLVKHAAIHSAGLWRDKDAQQNLIALLESSVPPVQRAAAEALGRVENRSAVPALLRSSAQPHDRVLEHSLIYALIEIDASSETSEGLKADSAVERRSALIALDQMNDGGLSASTITPLLSSPDSTLRQTALWIAGHHPEWGNELASFFLSRLEAKEIRGPDAEELKHQLAQFADSKPIQEIIGAHLSDTDTPNAIRKLLLESIDLAAPKAPPKAWVQGVGNCLANPDENLLRAAVAASRTLNQAKNKPIELSDPLLRLAQNPAYPEDLRVAALAALPPGSASLDPGLLTLLLGNLDPAKPVLIRSDAAGVLAKSKLTDDQLIDVADHLKTAGPLETTKLLEAFEQSTNEMVGLKLVESLQGCKSLASLRPDMLQKLLTQFSSSVQNRGKELLASLQVDTVKQSAHLEELMNSLGKGDIRRGQAVFNSQKAACSSCHAMGYLGGNVGPDLTTIGQVRTERDLLESIVYPSASFVRSFEPYVVRTKSDEDYSGVLKKDAPDEIVLATGPSTEVRIARSDIVDIRPGTVSVMPAGLDQQLTRQELSDLVAFLKATKWGAQ
jgi:putative heme-binding domain-containing protein